MSNGGPAFPTPLQFDANGNEINVALPGMSLRDWFAGMALQGIIAHGSDAPLLDVANGSRGGLIEAKAAYIWADAMLNARG